MALQTVQQPFSASSIWNASIGSDATFQVASGTETAAIRHTANVVPWIGGDAMAVYQASSTDPMTTWTYDSRADTPDWQNGGSMTNGSFQMPTPAALQFQTVDGWAIIVAPDGKHYYETWLGSYDSSKNQYHVSYVAENDVTGTGIAQATGDHDGIRAGGMSLLGGLIRTDELNNLDIPHAVAIAISSTTAKAGSNAASQMVWPATTVDGGSTSMYTGSVPMGALFAIPKNVDLSTIGIKTAEGMALAKAYQEYGGYVTDTAGSGTDVFGYVESGATSTQVNHLQQDIATIQAQLSMVTNNSAANPGGPGDHTAAADPATAPATPVSTPSAPATTPAAPAQPADTHVDQTVGTGSHSLLLKVSETAYQGDAQYTVSVDGQQVGGTLTAHATHGSGASDTVAVRGDWGTGAHDVTINFVNDAYAGTAATDRNLYVDGATFDGHAVANSSLTLAGNGAQHVGIPASADPSTPPATGTSQAISLGSGSDTLQLNVSQDAYQGNAQYTVSVDGKQVGGTQTASASHAAGQTQAVAVHGDWGAGDHTVAVNFLNDKYDGTTATDRNLYVDSASYNGSAVANSKLALGGGTGKIVFHDGDATPSTANGGSAVTVGVGDDHLVLKMSEDSYKGDAQYTVSVDGKQVGGTLTAHGAHIDGASDTVTVNGTWGQGDHTVAVKFLNDAWDGFAATDRNLYIDAASYNGATVGGAQHAIGAGTGQFHFHDYAL